MPIRTVFVMLACMVGGLTLPVISQERVRTPEIYRPLHTFHLNPQHDLKIEPWSPNISPLYRVPEIRRFQMPLDNHSLRSYPDLDLHSSEMIHDQHNSFAIPQEPSPRSDASATSTPKKATIQLDRSMTRAAQEQISPDIKVDFSSRVTLGEPFKIDVWIDKNSADQRKPLVVYMEQTDTVLYSPRVFKLKPGQRKTVVAQIIKSTAGLAQIQITSEGYAPLIVYVDAGFKADIRARTDTSILAPDGVYGIAFNLVDSQDLSVALDTPISLNIKASNALIRTAEAEKWGTELRMLLPRGATATDLFQIKPISTVGHPVTISAVALLDGDNLVLHENHISFDVHPAWWYTLGLAMLGGIIPGLYRTAVALTVKFRWRDLAIRIVSQILPGAIAGAVAYLLADLDVIGVKLDTSSPRSFCILGFLFAYVGLDVLMKKFAASRIEAHQIKQTEVPQDMQPT